MLVSIWVDVLSVEQLVGLQDDHGFAARGTEGGRLAAEEVGNDLLHLGLLEAGAGLDGQLSRHGAAEALGTVGEFLYHGPFVFDDDLVEEVLQLALFDVGRGGGDDKGSLPERAYFEAVGFEVGDEFVEDVGIGGGELAVDGEEELLGMGRGAVLHEPLEEDALVRGLLVDNQEA